MSTLRSSYNLQQNLADAFFGGYVYTRPAGEAYVPLQQGLASASANGEETFTVRCLVSFNPDTLMLGTYYWEAFKCGAKCGLADEDIYDYEVTMRLETNSSYDTYVNFDFTFTDGN